VAEQDRARWNDRYAREPPDFTPAASLLALGPRLRPGRPNARALDLACGTGRNAIYLAELGYSVDAWDISDVGLELLQSELDRRARAGRALAVAPRRVDLDAARVDGSLALPVAAYDLLLDYYFLDHALFPAMAAALRPGGLLLVETFFDSERGRERMPNPAYRLAPGELLRAFTELEVVEYLEDPAEGLARLLARR
jgi:SAM-dependent methyltransferase